MARWSVEATLWNSEYSGREKHEASLGLPSSRKTTGIAGIVEKTGAVVFQVTSYNLTRLTLGPEAYVGP